MENNIVINNNCWVACIDMLGFKKELLRFEKQSGVGHLDGFVKILYNDILDALKRGEKDWHGRVCTCWSSDTFVFYTPDDSVQSFNAISAAAIHFCCRLIWHSIFRFRGALGTGQFYADKKNNVFLGSAFIDAYEYAEKQNWIGFIVTPSAENKIIHIETVNNMPSHTLLYQYYQYDVPIKKKKPKNGNILIVEYTERLFAGKIHSFPSIQERFQRMQNGLSQKDLVKYENTFKFFKQCH